MPSNTDIDCAVSLAPLGRLRPLALLGGVAAVALLPVSASAFQAVVGGKTYEVSTFTGSYSTNAAKFALPVNGGQMPWWGSQSLATQFAAAVADDLGLSPPINVPVVGLTGVGPLFAASTGTVTVPFLGPIPVTNNSLYYQVGQFASGTYPFGALPPLPVPQSGLGSDLVPYAVATEVVPQSVPAPLPLLGAGAAFGFSRRLRSRIRRTTA
jgi:hypothetical protein